MGRRGNDVEGLQCEVWLVMGERSLGRDLSG